MSSKKAHRQQRREAERARTEARRGMNPALAFALVIAAAIGLTLGGVMLFGDRSGPGDPPWPGAVWSPAHGHWH